MEHNNENAQKYRCCAETVFYSDRKKFVYILWLSDMEYDVIVML